MSRTLLAGLTGRPPQFAAGPFSDADALVSAAGAASMDLGTNSTLVVVLNPVSAAPQVQTTGVTPICCTSGLGTHGWALFLTTNAVCSDAPQVGMFYCHATAPGYTWVQTLGNIARTPGKPVRIVFVDDGASWRVSVNGSPIVVSAVSGAYSAVTAAERFTLGKFFGLANFADPYNLCASFAILHRAVSDAEAIAESGRSSDWNISLASDAACTIDAYATRDYPTSTATWVTRGSAPITLVKAGTVPVVDIATNAFLRIPLGTRPDDTGLWESKRACGVNYRQVTQQARWLVDTDAEELVVEQIVTEGLPYYTDVAARIIGGATPTPVGPLGGYTTPYALSGRLSLGGGGVAKVVEVVASVQSNIASPLTFLGGFPYAIAVPHGRTATVRAATTPTSRLVIYGDSMVAERTSNPEINGVAGLIRADYPGQVTVDAALNRSLYDDVDGGGLGQAGLVARLLSELDGTVSNTLLVWIGLEDHWRSLYTKANFTTKLASFLAAIRAAAPTVSIFVVTRTESDAPYNTNTYSDTDAAWRTATSDACVGIANCTVIDGSTLCAFNATNFNASDSATTPNKVHFTTAGAAAAKATLKTALGY